MDKLKASRDVKTVLTIGGSDPTGWAGIQADLLTLAHFRVRGLSVITALTSQTELEVNSVYSVPARFLKKQIETLLVEHKINAVKIGMLATKENADAAALAIKNKKLRNVVLDPVFTSTSRYPLFEKKGIASIKRLLPLVTIVTPNISEAEILSGVKIRNTADMKKAARLIHPLGAPYILIKGGHLKDAPVDVLFDGKKFYYYRGKRLKGKKEKFHGTGCLMSSAIAALLAKGEGVQKAIKEAKRYVMKVVMGR